MARNGKIARLPKYLREDLNAQLDDGVPGPKIVEWLNAQDEVKQMLGREFNGKPVSEQNLSQWRQGGFRDWLRHQEALNRAAALAEQGREYVRTSKGVPLSDHLAPAMALALAARIESAVATHGENPDAPDTEAEGRLRDLSRELARLRRDDHRSARLRLEIDEARRRDKKRKEKQRAKEAAQAENAFFSAVLKKAARRAKADCIFAMYPDMTPEGRKIVLEEMGLSSAGKPAPDAPPESSPGLAESE